MLGIGLRLGLGIWLGLEIEKIEKNDPNRNRIWLNKENKRQIQGKQRAFARSKSTQCYLLNFFTGHTRNAVEIQWYLSCQTATAMTQMLIVCFPRTAYMNSASHKSGTWPTALSLEPLVYTHMGVFPEMKIQCRIVSWNS
jgi:hypothetical protein